MTPTRALCIVVLAAAWLACRKPAEPPVDPRVVATVNDEVITRADFEAELSRELQAVDSAPHTPEQVEPFKRVLLDTLIDKTLLLQAAKQSNLTLSPDEVDRRMLRLSSDFGAEGFDEALSKGQLSVTEFRRKTEALLLTEKLFQEQVYPRVAVTEEAIRQYYEQHPGEFQEPEQVRAAQIVVRGLDEARRVQVQLRAGKKFADLARRYSLSADAKVGGDLGFFPRGVMPPQFDETVFKLQVGQLSDIVTTDYGFHLFRVLERKHARKLDFLDVRGDIEAKLLAEARAKAQAAYLQALKEKSKVRINQPALLAVTGKGQPSPALSGAAKE